LPAGPFEGVLWIVWDGASYDVVAELLCEGALPALRALTGDRPVALAPLAPNCQTPPSLAALYTGAGIVEHGVTGFRMPVREPEAAFVDSRSGFEMPVRRPLIWNEAAAAGVWVGLAHVAWGIGPTATAVDLAIDGFRHLHARPEVIGVGPDADRSLDGQSFRIGDGDVVVRKDGTAYEALAPATADRVRLTPGPDLRMSPVALRLGPGLATRLGVLTRPGGGHLLVHTGLWQMRAMARGPLAVEAPAGAFGGKLLGDAYRSGELGTRVVDGGDGGAEQALLESARCQVDSFTGSCELVLRRARPDGLVVSYLPTIDEIQHELFRWWPGGDSDEASTRAREVIRTAYRLADAQLARLARLVGPGCTIVVCSDHGAGVVRRDYHVNETLARAGLARFDDEGAIDVRASSVAYHPANNGSVWVNEIGRPGGLVAAAERDSVVAAAEHALRAARDPLTGRPPADVARVGGADRTLLGDLMIRLRPGYDSTWRRAPDRLECVPGRKGGAHTTPTGESTLRGVLAISGGHRDDLDVDEIPITHVHHIVQRTIAAVARRPG
jgi:type I phosphodiesterase/nucleotide pyrophosphatase